MSKARTDMRNPRLSARAVADHDYTTFQGREVVIQRYNEWVKDILDCIGDLRDAITDADAINRASALRETCGPMQDMAPHGVYAAHEVIGLHAMARKAREALARLVNDPQSDRPL